MINNYSYPGKVKINHKNVKIPTFKVRMYVETSYSIVLRGSFPSFGGTDKNIFLTFGSRVCGSLL